MFLPFVHFRSAALLALYALHPVATVGVTASSANFWVKTSSLNLLFTNMLPHRSSDPISQSLSHTFVDHYPQPVSGNDPTASHKSRNRPKAEDYPRPFPHRDSATTSMEIKRQQVQWRRNDLADKRRCQLRNRQPTLFRSQRLWKGRCDLHRQSKAGLDSDAISQHERCVAD